MERIILGQLQNPAHIDAIQHFARYDWVSGLLKGKVLDLACGVGYGSQILLKSSKLTEYFGGDISSESVETAQKHFASAQIHFQEMDIYHVPFADRCFDTVISFETLEHLETPELGVVELRRVLKDDGILMGSVPTAYYDQLITEVWQKNPFHITRFSFGDLSSLLAKYFQHFVVLSFTEEMGTVISLLHPTADANLSLPVAGVNHGEGVEEVRGSFIFLATNDQLTFERIMHFVSVQPHFKTGADYVRFYQANWQILEQEKNAYIDQLEGANKLMADLTKQKDDYIKKLEDSSRILNQMISEKDSYITVLGNSHTPLLKDDQ